MPKPQPQPDEPLNTSPESSIRTGTSVEILREALLDNLFYSQGRTPSSATLNDWYQALAYVVRDRLLNRWMRSAHTYKQRGSRTVCYLSAEFLLGPHLENNLVNLRIRDNAKEALKTFGIELSDLLEQEVEPGLGNGGLGRLAACYMDSLATQKIPAIGYGIRYEFGIFNQEIQDGCQVEKTDKWLAQGNPWELPRPKLSFDVRLGGHTEHRRDEHGNLRVQWHPNRIVKGVAFDTPILGYGVHNANLLRLWKSEAPESFDFHSFNTGDYYGAVDKKVTSENITKVLYPNDEPIAGKRLRLEQQYFLVSCSIQDMVRIHLQTSPDLHRLHEKYAAQLNDTHPALAIPELMRILIDEHSMLWDEAWHITRQTFAFTNHTLLPEALETWPLPLFAEMLPRHLEIIYEINWRFMDEARMKAHREEDGRLGRLSIIDDHGEKFIRMANLACVGSHAINGVACLHTKLLTTGVLRDFHDLWPERFHNVTNGVTQRRFLLVANPMLSGLFERTIGCAWVRDARHLVGLEAFLDDDAFLEDWIKAKHAAKHHLAHLIHQRTGIAVNPTSMFDIQAKRIHEYKRQHLNLLHVITLYNRLKDNPSLDTPPRTIVFGGKAAPGYRMAKLIIQLINAVADMINRDSAVNQRLQVVFYPNFNVKNAQNIYPAADLSEQISTAGKEASGTGNMKFSMNGALTIGTLDGANIEIREAVGHENFFLFGLTADQVTQLKRDGYNPREYYQQDTELKAAIDLIDSGYFSHGDRTVFQPLLSSLLGDDSFMLLADYRAYVDTQQEVGRTFKDSRQWARLSVMNVARMGRFSSDRAIHQYCKSIWNVESVDVE